MQIKVLGTGCANCKTTLKLIEEVAAEKGAAVQLEKVEDIQAIMAYGVMSTPAVDHDARGGHDAGWLAGSPAAPATQAGSGGCCGGGSCA
jgi:hypothetical protein